MNPVADSSSKILILTGLTGSSSLVEGRRRSNGDMQLVCRERLKGSPRARECSLKMGNLSTSRCRAELVSYPFLSIDDRVLLPPRTYGTGSDDGSHILSTMPTHPRCPLRPLFVLEKFYRAPLLRLRRLHAPQHHQQDRLVIGP